MEKKQYIALAGVFLLLAFIFNMFSMGDEFMSVSYIMKKGLSLLFLIASTCLLAREKLSKKSQSTRGEKVLVLLILLVVYFGWAINFCYDMGAN
jgi:hypothetical protein